MEEDGEFLGEKMRRFVVVYLCASLFAQVPATANPLIEHCLQILNGQPLSGFLDGVALENLQFLGQGAMGKVSTGTALVTTPGGTQRVPVVVKEAATAREGADQVAAAHDALRREYAVYAAISPESVGWVKKDGKEYLVMKLFGYSPEEPNRPAESLLAFGSDPANLTALKPEHVAHLVKRAADQLDLMHAKGLRYNDGKPQNALVQRGSRDGTIPPELLLMDLGAVSVEGHPTSEGSRPYMSPSRLRTYYEWVNNRREGLTPPSRADDAYALGHTLLDLVVAPGLLNPRRQGKQEVSGYPEYVEKVGFSVLGNLRFKRLPDDGTIVTPEGTTLRVVPEVVMALTTLLNRTGADVHQNWALAAGRPQEFQTRYAERFAEDFATAGVDRKRDLVWELVRAKNLGPALFAKLEPTTREQVLKLAREGLAFVGDAKSQFNPLTGWPQGSKPLFESFVNHPSVNPRVSEATLAAQSRLAKNKNDRQDMASIAAKDARTFRVFYARRFHEAWDEGATVEGVQANQRELVTELVGTRALAPEIFEEMDNPVFRNKVIEVARLMSESADADQKTLLTGFLQHPRVGGMARPR